jgi:prepilin-type processing-associated H-X9-DG protein
VIAIIAILAAILFPVFSKAREKARQSSCASNMKQIGVALLQYEQDYDECHPSWNISYSGKNIHWQNLIYAYIKSMKVFTCPSNTSIAKLPWFSYEGVPNAASAADEIDMHYGANINSVGGAWFHAYYSASRPNNSGCGPFAAEGYRTFNISEFASPATIIDLTEVYDANSPGATQNNSVDFMIDSVDFNNNLFAGHTGASNYLFVDGHVKSLRPSLTITTQANLWTIDNTALCDKYGGKFKTNYATGIITYAESKYMQ